MEVLRAFARNSRIGSNGCFCLLLAVLPVALVSFTGAQQQNVSVPGQSDVVSRDTGRVVSVQDLVGEAERNNPEIAAALSGYEAATHVQARSPLFQKRSSCCNSSAWAARSHSPDIPTAISGMWAPARPRGFHTQANGVSVRRWQTGKRMGVKVRLNRYGGRS